MDSLWLLVIKFANEHQDDFIAWYRSQSTIELNDDEYEYLRAMMESLQTQIVLTLALKALTR